MRPQPSVSPGDWVIFSTFKRSTHPGPNAREVRPEQKGDAYTYVVDKFWLVDQVNGEELFLRTRRGKTRVLNVNDPHLHVARWWERIIYKDRFPKPAQEHAGS